MQQEFWILKEKELFPPLKKWLNNQGFKVFTEILNMDVVAKKEDEIVGFELKMACSKTVIHQAYRTMTLCGKAYVVTPVTPRIESIERCKERGVGIIKINEKIDIILEANRWDHGSIIQHYIKVEDLDKMEEGIMSGTPNLKGEGLAQCLLIEIRKYLELNPKAGWEQIYKNVPNHYSNYKSMANSMRSWQGFTLR